MKFITAVNDSITNLQKNIFSFDELVFNKVKIGISSFNLDKVVLCQKGGSMLKYNGIKQAVSEELTKYFSYLKDPCMLLCMEYNIVQIRAVASHGGTDSSDPIFNDSAAYILNLSDGIGYVDFKIIGLLRLNGIDLQLHVTPQEKV